MYDIQELQMYRKMGSLSKVFIFLCGINILSSLGQYSYTKSESMGRQINPAYVFCLFGIIAVSLIAVYFLVKRSKSSLLGCMAVRTILQLMINPTFALFSFIWILYFFLSKKCKVYFASEYDFEYMQKQAADLPLNGPIWLHQEPVTQVTQQSREELSPAALAIADSFVTPPSAIQPQSPVIPVVQTTIPEQPDTTAPPTPQ